MTDTRIQRIIKESTMRMKYVLTMILLAGCAGQPPAQPPIASRVVQVQPPASAAVGASSESTHTVKVDTTNIVAVQKAGYKLVTKDGVPLYCRTDTLTGSRISTRTTCLTEQELYDQMNATKQSMEHLAAHQTGPTGH
jgi:hypothetical protein